MLRRLAAVVAAVLLFGGAALPSPSGPALPGGGVAHADEIRDQVWQVLTSLNVPHAWDLGKGAGVTVAVLDSGVDAAQPDLTGSVTTGPDFTAGANPAGVAPKRLHGTNMASIIAAHGHGAGRLDGVIGVAPEAKILSVRVILENDEPGFAYFNGNERFTGSIAKGIRYAADHGAQVINMSIGKRDPNKDERQAVAYAISRGAVVVAAAGNEGAGRAARRTGNAPFSYPASFPGVISVAAVDAGHRHAGFSNRNSAVVVSAPGVRIIGAGPGHDYWIGDGTSPATAFVSGIAALIKSRYPRLAPALVTQAIAAGTAYHPAGGYDSAVGFGEVDAAAALQAAQRLSTVKTGGAGLPATAAFGAPEASPVQIIRHDTGLLVTYGLLGALGLSALMTLVILAMGRVRRHAGSAAPPPPAAGWLPPQGR